MKAFINIIWLVCAALALSFAACTDDAPLLDSGDEGDGAVVYPTIRLSVSEMSMVQSSRASAPLTPEDEKYVETIALLQFDPEGIHIKGDHTYHFIDFRTGTVDGVRVDGVDQSEYGIVETTLDKIALTEYKDTCTVCLIANVTEAQILHYYDIYRDPEQSFGRMNLDRFKTWALPFVYEETPTDRYDEAHAGHLEEMYMFGYYEGPVDPSKSKDIAVDLGRLASRLDITVVNETGADIEKRLGYHFDNVGDSAYFFPIKMGMPPASTGMTRTVICAGDKPVEGDDDSYSIVPRTFPDEEAHLRYFYVAAHSAKSYSDATQLHIFYGRPIIDDKDMKKDADGNIIEEGTVRVPLCNVHPSEADEVTNGYSLSRNTRYHFTIRLVDRSAITSAPSRRSLDSSSADPSCPLVQISDGSLVDTSSGASIVYGDTPGDITVYLP